MVKVSLGDGYKDVPVDLTTYGREWNWIFGSGARLSQKKDVVPFQQGRGGPSLVMLDWVPRGSCNGQSVAKLNENYHQLR